MRNARETALFYILSGFHMVVSVITATAAFCGICLALASIVNTAFFFFEEGPFMGLIPTVAGIPVAVLLTALAHFTLTGPFNQLRNKFHPVFWLRKD